MERILSGAPVSVPKDFSRSNEYAFRSFVEGELADTYRKSSHVIIPFGKLLGFAGSTGKLVTFGLNGSDDFTISIDGAAALVLTTTGDLTALETSLTTAYTTADSTLSAALTLAYNAADAAVTAALTAAYTAADTAAAATVMAAIGVVDGKLTASVGFTTDVNGRIANLKLLSNGSTSSVVFKADAFDFFDGISERALISAAGGILTVNGDIAVTGAILVGAVRWPVALQAKPFYKADGETIQWAGGSALSAIPEYSIAVPTGVALSAGEAWEASLQSITTVGATLRLKISTPGATSSVTDTTDSAGGGGDPDRVMDKADSADAYNVVYNFRVQGTINVTSTNEGGGIWSNDGVALISTWFNDGGGWDEGPGIAIYPADVGIDFLSGVNNTGAHAFDVTAAISWGNAIGQHGGKEYGVSYEYGGSLTDFVSVQYTKQSASGTRTGSPNGEPATILVLPRNI